MYMNVATLVCKYLSAFEFCVEVMYLLQVIRTKYASERVGLLPMVLRGRIVSREFWYGDPDCLVSTAQILLAFEILFWAGEFSCPAIYVIYCKFTPLPLHSF